MKAEIAAVAAIPAIATFIRDSAAGSHDGRPPLAEFQRRRLTSGASSRVTAGRVAEGAPIMPASAAHEHSRPKTSPWPARAKTSGPVGGLPDCTGVVAIANRDECRSRGKAAGLAGPATQLLPLGRRAAGALSPHPRAMAPFTRQHSRHR